MLILTQFVLRLSFGLALAMGLTSPRKVTSGYFRNHSYVLMGLATLATLAAMVDRQHLLLWPPLLGAILSYASVVAWLYEKPRVGSALLWLVAATSLIGAWSAQRLPRVGPDAILQAWPPPMDYDGTENPPTVLLVLLWRLSAASGGLLLGATIAAMFLGHWYLNTPTMELAPLRRLMCLMVIAVAAHALVSGIGLTLNLNPPPYYREHSINGLVAFPGVTGGQYPLLGIRWLAGILSTAVLTWMAWQTLKIPNTQSATGILYVAVITTYIGELASLLLSQSTGFPL